MDKETYQLYPHLTTKHLLLQIGIGIMYVFLLSRLLCDAESVSWPAFFGGALVYITTPTLFRYMNNSERFHRWQQLTSLWSRISIPIQVIIWLTVTSTVGITLLVRFPDSTDLFYSFGLGFMLVVSLLGIGLLVWRRLRYG